MVALAGVAVGWARARAASVGASTRRDATSLRGGAAWARCTGAAMAWSGHSSHNGPPRPGASARTVSRGPGPHGAGAAMPATSTGAGTAASVRGAVGAVSVEVAPSGIARPLLVCRVITWTPRVLHQICAGDTYHVPYLAARGGGSAAHSDHPPKRWSRPARGAAPRAVVNDSRSPRRVWGHAWPAQHQIEGRRARCARYWSRYSVEYTPRPRPFPRRLYPVESEDAEEADAP